MVRAAAGTTSAKYRPTARAVRRQLLRKTRKWSSDYQVEYELTIAGYARICDARGLVKSTLGV